MKVLVTGGGGFLGKAIITQLLKEGHQIHTLNRSHYPDLQSLGVRCFQGNISVIKDVERAAEGVDAIIHTAAKAGMWGDYDDFYQSNVIGTRNVIATCKKLGIPKLVYTSSPSVTFQGQDQESVDESVPYPSNFNAHYPATKAIAEKEVISSKDDSLSVVSLRPHLIWGPGDNHLAPRLIAKQKSKRLRFIGDVSSTIDAVYIENAAQAHVIALNKLSKDSIINGKNYFISNHEPWPTETVINTILHSAGLDPVRKRLPLRLVMILATFLENIYTFFKIKKEPPMTRFVAQQLSTSHWFDNKAAREELGYIPKVSMVEGFEKLKQYYRLHGTKLSHGR